MIIPFENRENYITNIKNIITNINNLYQFQINWKVT